MDKYIKMVLALPDKFFEGWEWNEGDQFVNIQENGEQITGFIGNHSLFGNIGKYIFEVTHIGVVLRGVLRPLPSQRQLQEICMNIINCTPMELLKFFDAWIYEDDVKPKVKFESWDELWLMYTGWVWGRLKWDGEKWI